MSDDRIYIRFKGRVLGPLTKAKALEMVKRGQITRQHELSPDGSNWRLASEYEEFFPVAVMKTAASVTAQSKGAEQGAVAESAKEWYAHFDGGNQGPVDESGVRGWITGGKVSATTMIWKTGMSEWMEAGVIRPEWFARGSAGKSRQVGVEVSSLSNEGGDAPVATYVSTAIKPRGWILFLAICAVIFASFGVIFSSLMFISAASGPGSGPGKALLVVTTLTNLAAWGIAFYICILLFRIASELQVLRYQQTPEGMLKVLQAYSNFWSTLGVYVATVLVIGFLLTFMFLALGASLAPLTSPFQQEATTVGVFTGVNGWGI